MVRQSYKLPITAAAPLPVIANTFPTRSYYIPAGAALLLNCAALPRYYLQDTFTFRALCQHIADMIKDDMPERQQAYHSIYGPIPILP